MKHDAANGYLIMSILIVMIFLDACGNGAGSGLGSEAAINQGETEGEDFGDMALVIIDTDTAAPTEFEAEVAKDQETRTRGLMFRTKMDEDKGMLFVFDEEKMLRFWMKNTKIPLDMIFISEDREIVSIQKNAMPCITATCATYSSNETGKYVLEINGGLSNKLGIMPGQKVRFLQLTE